MKALILLSVISLVRAINNKLLITANLKNSTTFVLDLEHDRFCGALPNFPENGVAGASGGLLKQKIPFVCIGDGGSYLNHTVNQCYLYQDRSWAKSVVLPEDVVFSTMTVLNDTTVWITGGFGNSSLSLLVNPFEKRVVSGPQLREGLIQHCTVNVDGNNIFFISGNQYKDNLLRKTQIYTFSTNKWQDGPDMLQTRLVPACSYLTLSSGKKIILVADDETTEYLEFEAGDRWKFGPKIPYWITVPTMVGMADGSAILFGHDADNRVLKFDCLNGDPNHCLFTELNVQLPFDSSGPAAMLVPDEIAPPC